MLVRHTSAARTTAVAPLGVLLRLSALYLVSLDIQPQRCQDPTGAARGHDYGVSVGDGAENSLASCRRGGSPAAQGVQGAAGGIGDHAGSAAAAARDRGLSRTALLHRSVIWNRLETLRTFLPSHCSLPRFLKAVSVFHDTIEIWVGVNGDPRPRYHRVRGVESIKWAATYHYLAGAVIPLSIDRKQFRYILHERSVKGANGGSDEHRRHSGDVLDFYISKRPRLLLVAPFWRSMDYNPGAPAKLQCLLGKSVLAISEPGIENQNYYAKRRRRKGRNLPGRVRLAGDNHKLSHIVLFLT